MNANHSRRLVIAARHRGTPRRGFTLVEMLTSVVILAILAGIAYGALQVVREDARKVHTQATIQKISRVLMAKYESYRTRRVPGDISVLAGTPSALGAMGAQSSEPYEHRMARARLSALRELMRLEMPDRWSDVIGANRASNPAINDTSVLLVTSKGKGKASFYNPTSSFLVSSSVPSATIRYQSAYYAGFRAGGLTAVNNLAASKCLYLIVMGDPEAASQFREDEIQVFDASNMPVFVDGWGHPIRFLRWPAGFVAQVYSTNENTVTSTLNGDSNLQTGRPLTDHDPFDPMKIQDNAYSLYPLIYSAGPDGKYDINLGKTSTTGTYAYSVNASNASTSYQDFLDAYQGDTNGGYLIGRPMNEDAATTTDLFTSLRHYDNIHNHRVEAR